MKILNPFKIITIQFLLLGSFLPCLGNGKTATPKKETIKTSLTWATSKADLMKLEEKFKDPKTDKDAKVKLLPEANAKLSETQDLKLSPAEKTEQIHTIISLIASTIEVDFANSNTNTVYFDYKENKKAYLEEIEKVSSKKEKEEILEAFKDLEEYEKDLNKPEPENEGGE